MDADPVGVCVLSDTAGIIAKLFYPKHACQAGRCTTDTPELPVPGVNPWRYTKPFIRLCTLTRAFNFTASR
jgi:hypothetical protein